MAIGALQHAVLPAVDGEGVIEHCAFPLRSVVAVLARRRKARRRVIRVRRAVKVGEVTADAGLRRALELAADMALRAINRDMTAC